jgi:hypothetical protein
MGLVRWLRDTVWPKSGDVVRMNPGAAKIASEMFTTWIERDPLGALTITEFPPAGRDRYSEKWRLYREAAVVSALRSVQRNNSRYKDILTYFELQILPPHPTPWARSKVASLNAAMKDLGHLLTCVNNGNGELSWALRWFEELGGLANPVTLTLFVSGYVRFWTTVRETLEDLADEKLLDLMETTKV